MGIFVLNFWFRISLSEFFLYSKWRQLVLLLGAVVGQLGWLLNPRWDGKFIKFRSENFKITEKKLLPQAINRKFDF